jgi:putative SOS response-associated peptidase YedK
VRVHDLSVPGNLSRVSWKLSRTVLRGGTNSNVGPLLGKRQGSAKQPYCFEVNDGQLFAFAGLWEGWKDANGTCVKTCTILTTTPNAVTSAIHDRMPVILDPADYDVWLDPGMKDSAGVSELLKPFDANAMRCYPVSNRVNNVQADDAECARPVTLETFPQQQLFF